jgi:hypothetical protein
VYAPHVLTGRVRSCVAHVDVRGERLFTTRHCTVMISPETIMENQPNARFPVQLKILIAVISGSLVLLLLKASDLI